MLYLCEVTVNARRLILLFIVVFICHIALCLYTVLYI